MNKANAVYTPKIVRTPLTIVPDTISAPEFVVDNMYLTKQDTEEGTTKWYLNVVGIQGQEFVYRLDVYYSI